MKNAKKVEGSNSFTFKWSFISVYVCVPTCLYEYHVCVPNGRQVWEGISPLEL